MHTPLRRLVGWSLALSVGGMLLGACSSGTPTTAKPTLSVPVNVSPGPSAQAGFGNASAYPVGASPAPHCDLPKKIKQQKWVPTDLPLPAGSYQYKNYGQQGGYDRGLFVVPGTLDTAVRFILDEWPKAGWILGRGDSESNEAEASFTKAPAFGAFKVAGQFCSPAYNIMLLIFVTDREAVLNNLGPSPTPSASPSG